MLNLEDTREQSRPERLITALKYLRSGAWKHFGRFSKATTSLQTHLLACRPNEPAEAPQTSGVKSGRLFLLTILPLFMLCLQVLQRFDLLK